MSSSHTLYSIESQLRLLSEELVSSHQHLDIVLDNLLYLFNHRVHSKLSNLNLSVCRSLSESLLFLCENSTSTIDPLLSDQAFILLCQLIIEIPEFKLTLHELPLH